LLRATAHKFGWAKDDQIAAMTVPDLGEENLGTIGLAAKRARSAALGVVKKNAAKDLGLDPNRMNDAKYLGENLARLQEHVGQKDDFIEAVKEEGDSSGKIEVPADDLVVGEELTVDGEPVKVSKVERYFVTLDDGRRFGRQIIGKGETLFVEGYEPKPEATTPKLGAMEKGTGDLLKDQPEAFALTGERGTDQDRIAAAKAKSEQDKAEARAIEKKQQLELSTPTDAKEDVSTAKGDVPAAKEGSGSAKEGLAGANEEKLIGMGGAVPEEFKTNPQTPTSIKNAQVDIERAKRGLPPVIQPARRSFGEAWDRAMARIDHDPGYPDRLLSELREKPRA
jgi:hypothetical protein